MSDRAAVITDIHANLPALQAALTRIDGLGNRPRPRGLRLRVRRPARSRARAFLMPLAERKARELLAAEAGALPA